MVQRRVIRRSGVLADAETGEVLGRSFLAIRSAKRGNGFNMEWAALSQDKSRFLADHGDELGVPGFRLLWALISRADYENRLLLTQSGLGRDLKMAPSGISRAMRKLLVLDLIEKRDGYYLLSPEVAWKGSGRNHIEALKEWRERRSERMAAVAA